MLSDTQPKGWSISPKRVVSITGISNVFSHPQIHVVAAVFRFTPHRFTTAHIHPYRSFASIHSIRSLLPALAFSNAQFGQKMRQTSCRQHPSTALRASCVRGTRSTRSGSHTTHRLNTSFRFSPLAFQPCYPRWLKAVFTIRFKPASPTPTPDHPPLRKNAVEILKILIEGVDSTTKKMFTKITAIK